MKLSRKKFEEIVADALDELPAEIAEAISNVYVVVEPWPSRELGTPHFERSRELDHVAAYSDPLPFQ